jgi:xanthine dehydrogenase accessory factor
MLAAQGASFVTATVVRAQRPTSVQAGNVALVTSDGAIQGFVGGVCAEHSVRLYSLKVLESGEPVLLKILPDADKYEDAEEGAGQEMASDEEGSVTVQNPCLSGGAIEVFLEPVLPLPRVHLVGGTPIAGALERLAPEIGLKVVPAVKGVISPVTGDLALIVAAHGRDELDTVRQGLVASPKRAATLIEELRADGMSDEMLAQVDAPAGLDIEAHTPAEIALSILAQVITVRRGGSYSPKATSGAAAAAPVEAIDPVCGMTVLVDADTPRAERDGETFYFCRPGCKEKFESEIAAPAVEPATATATATSAPTVAVDPVCGMSVLVDADTPKVEHDGETFYFCCNGCKAKFEKEHLHVAAAT